jgi:hypothetical protein
MRAEQIERAPKTNDYQILQNLKGLFGLSTAGHTLETYMAALDEDPDSQRPFLMADIRPVYTRFCVLSHLIKPRRSSYLLDVLSETPDCIVLLTDQALVGRDALFVAKFLGDPEEINTWVRAMHAVNLHVGTSGPDSVMAAPLRAFTS